MKRSTDGIESRRVCPVHLFVDIPRYSGHEKTGHRPAGRSAALSLVNKLAQQRKVNMRKLVEHSMGALVMAALIALVVPPSLMQQLPSQPSAVAATSPFAGLRTGTVTKPMAAATGDGRWKLGGDGSCYWDPDDSGPDQCSPNQGRWKLGGDGSCYWDKNDSGPNQCEPESAAPPEGLVSAMSPRRQP